MHIHQPDIDPRRNYTRYFVPKRNPIFFPQLVRRSDSDALQTTQTSWPTSTTASKCPTESEDMDGVSLLHIFVYPSTPSLHSCQHANCLFLGHRDSALIQPYPPTRLWLQTELRCCSLLQSIFTADGAHYSPTTRGLAARAKRLEHPDAIPNQ
ncbi:uncharacterized protein BDW70DRAFT_134197 [Aspergillus foveolatus]|uniref:uncharacterized protein n=1 Tax=Aspergillus foveolatus TaxID=210207 RepID=UPI003CCDFDB3